ncbi:MAG: ATP-dependent zinc metalloprotease FtsH [Eubacterium sp.]|nr:ATP-dependent zinc metalloprotease FtsH [Eubacterium sp.]
MENNNENNNNNGKGPKRPGVSATIVILIISVILTLIFWQQFNKFKSSGEQEVSYDKFVTMIKDKQVESVEIYSAKIYFKPKETSDGKKDVTYYVVRTDDLKLVDRLADSGVKFSQIDEGGSAILRTVLSYAIMIGAFYILMMLIMRGASKGGGIMGVGKSNAKVYDMQKDTGVTFNDVAGEEEAKESLAEVVDFLHEPEKYLAIGAKLPKGALLVGPPGTGKTLLAKAVAGEAKVPFFSISGSEFVEMYVGVGASRVRDLFRQANQKAPCIIFIDEIDAIGRSRDTRHMGGDSEREQTLNQLLSEMDGFDTSKGIVILAATNRPEVLDKALLRPGRFDRRVVVERPDLKGREDILKVHAKNVKQDETVDLHELALTTSGAVGADLANIINEAALLAVRKGRQFVSQKDLIESVEVVFAGKEKKNKILSDEEKRLVAYHETGHALMTVLQKNTVPVQKITIVPRTNGALGYVWQVPDEEKSLETQAELEADIVIACAGRAAEALKFPSVTTGAASDIQQATEKARKMVTMYGMSEKFGMVQLEGITGEYLDRRAVQQCSDETETKVDNEVRGIIKRAYARAFKALKKNEAILDAIAAFLYEHETITGKEFVEIYEKVSGRKVDLGKRLLSDSLLKSDKDKEKQKTPDAEVKAKAKEKEKKRQEGYYGAFHSPYAAAPTTADLEEAEEEDVPQEQEEDVTEAEMPEKEILPEPEDDTPKPWETFAREQEVRAQAPDLQEEISGDEPEEEPEDADMGMSKELDDFEGAEDVMEEEPEEESEDEPEEESADDDDKE